MRVAWSLLLVTTACLPTIDRPAPTPCDLADAGVAAPPEFLLAGREAVLERPFEALDCLPEVVTATAEVRDADNLEVPATLALRRAGRTAVASVRFTPSTPGPLSLTVTFEPTLRRTQRTWQVVQASQAGTARASIAQPCVREGATGRGAWLCLESFSQLSVWRGGQRLQALPALDVAARGDVVWVVGPGQLERFVDRGGAFLVREPDAAMPFDVAGALLPVDDARFVLVGATTLSAWVVPADGPPMLEASATRPRGLCLREERFATAPGDARLWLTCPARDGFTRLCGLDLTAIEGSTCREVPGTAVGLEAGAVWTAAGAWVTRWGLTGASAASLPDGWRAREGRTLEGASWPLVTTPSGDRLLVVERPGGPVLEAAPAGVAVLGHGPGGVLVEDGARRALLPRSP